MVSHNSIRDMKFRSYAISTGESLLQVRSYEMNRFFLLIVNMFIVEHP
jgi:hypothetical protein